MCQEVMESRGVQDIRRPARSPPSGSWVTAGSWSCRPPELPVGRRTSGGSACGLVTGGQAPAGVEQALRAATARMRPVPRFVSVLPGDSVVPRERSRWWFPLRA
jgi:hypothetical protein